VEGRGMKLIDYRLALCISIVLLVNAVFLATLAYRDIDAAYNMLLVEKYTGQKLVDVFVNFSSALDSDALYLKGLREFFASLMLFLLSTFILIPEILFRGRANES
jgi:hypothetical protein